MRRFFIIRHGETDWNSQRKLQGHVDIALNSQGLRQAQGLVDFLTFINPDLIISSDLSRALQTAQIACPGQKIETTPLLREINLGQAESLTREQVQQNWGMPLWEQWSSFKLKDYPTQFPSGESRQDGIERLLLLLKQTEQNFPQSQRLAFFSHGLLLRSFAQWSEEIETQVFQTPNGCVYEWEFENVANLNFNSAVAKRPRLRQIYFQPEESLIL